jgi:hypothetical protein
MKCKDNFTFYLTLPFAGWSRNRAVSAYSSRPLYAHQCNGLCVHVMKSSACIHDNLWHTRFWNKGYPFPPLIHSISIRHCSIRHYRKGRMLLVVFLLSVSVLQFSAFGWLFLCSGYIHISTCRKCEAIYFLYPQAMGISVSSQYRLFLYTILILIPAGRYASGTQEDGMLLDTVPVA